MDALAFVSATWFGRWSRPPDRPSQVALGLGVLMVVLAVVPHAPRRIVSLLDLPSIIDLRRRRRFLMLASFVAAFLSLGYIAFYLRGGPRAHDAAANWIAGRALSRGSFSWAVADPSASFRARDLVFRAPDRVSTALPPGFPLLLAAGFLLGAPMVVGPLLAAALVMATWFLAREVLAGAPAGEVESGARLAAVLSIVSAALRYHTAETLPHAAAALALAAVVAAALRAHRTCDARVFGAAGLALGFLVATRPPESWAAGAAALGLALSRGSRRRNVVWLVGASLPGVLVLLAAQHAATGHWFWPGLLEPSAVAGGSAAGEGAAARAATRGVAGALGAFREHLLSIANFEPLALVAAVPVLTAVRRPAVAVTALVVIGHACLPGALDPVAPGTVASSGALLAVLPLEHALVAAGMARLFPRSFAPASIAALGLSLVGFALHASHAHAALAASPPGRPSFEPDALREASVTHGLLFFDDDDG
ncbi:MAG: hypothetical protein JOZ69_11005, partial [Myxococcales bacterium]|nr:hypothetical protein [Myxococcales bacterium]